MRAEGSSGKDLTKTNTGNQSEGNQTVGRLRKGREGARLDCSRGGWWWEEGSWGCREKNMLIWRRVSEESVSRD